MSSENEFTRSLEITSVPSTYFKQQSTEEVDAWQAKQRQVEDKWWK